nr:disease resistance protein RPP13-like isoform X6 [Ipomoea batatas]
MNFKWNGINVLSQLPRLKVLRLLSSSIGKEWIVGYKDVFYSLVYFEIFSTDLKCWEAWYTQFPKIERLLLRDCFHLRKLPCCFDNVKTLKSIELTRCIPSAVKSAKEIEEHKYGNKDLVVIEKETIIQNPTDFELLMKLTLYGVGFVCDEKINILSKLPRLEVLKLQRKLFVGEEWEIQEGVIFCQLIALVIHAFVLKHWKASSQNFSKLEHLYVEYCRELREIPIDFAEISTLKSIKLLGCLPSAVESAMKIQDEQCDYGNNDMVVIEEDTLDGLKFEKSLSEEEPEEDK